MFAGISQSLSIHCRLQIFVNTLRNAERKDVTIIMKYSCMKSENDIKSELVKTILISAAKSKSG